MGLSVYGRCCLLGLVLFSAAGLDLATGQVEGDTPEEQLEYLNRKYGHVLNLRLNYSQPLENRYEWRKIFEDSPSENSTNTDPCQVESDCFITETNSSGAGWIVLQQRFDGSVDFNRSWSDYKNGFGTVGANSEFWWGLERLHQLTKTGQYELLLEFIDNKDEYLFARYSDFLVEGEAQKYRLAKLGGYSGTVGDINEQTRKSEIPTGQKFTTFDRDNDPAPVNCAKMYGGGWWYNYSPYACGRSPNTEWNNYFKWHNKKTKTNIFRYTRMSIRSKV